MSKKIFLNVVIDEKGGVKSMNDLTNAIGTSITTMNGLEEASRALTEELAKTDIGTKAYNDLAGQLRVVNTELKNQELALEALDNEQFAGELKSVAGGLTDMAGGLALIGVQGESLEKIAQTFAQVEGASKLVSGGIEAYSSGMKVMNNLTVRATALHNAMAISQTAQGNASALATIKMKALNLIMKANPALLLVSAVGALAGAMYLFSNSAEDAKEKQAELNEEKKKYNEQLNTEADNYIKLRDLRKGGASDLKNELDILKAKGATDREVYDKESELINKSIANLNYRLGYIGKLSLEEKAQLKTLKNDLIVLEIEYNNKLKEKQDKANSDLKKTREDNLTQIKAYLKEANELNFTAQENEINNETEKYNNLVKLAGKNKKLLEELEIAHKNNINEINVKYAKQDEVDLTAHLKEVERIRKESEIELQNKLEEISELNRQAGQDARQNEIDSLNDYYFELITIAETNGLDVANLKEEQARKLAEIDDKYREEELEKIKNFYIEVNVLIGSLGEAIASSFSNGDFQSILATFDALNDSVTRLGSKENLANFKKLFTEPFNEESMANVASMAEQFTKVTTSVISAVFQAQAENDMAQKQELFSQEQEMLDNSLANRLISQSEYDAKVEQLEQKKREAEKQAKQKAFKQQQNLAVVNAIMSTAAGVASALTVPPPAGQILAGINAGIGAVQIGIIKSQKFKASRGGKVQGSGSSYFDSVDALLAPGETVINAQSSSMFPNLLSEINKIGGGVALAPSLPNTNSNIGGNSGGSTNQNGEIVVKAIVSESDMTDAQGRVSRYKSNSTFFK